MTNKIKWPDDTEFILFSIYTNNRPFVAHANRRKTLSRYIGQTREHHRTACGRIWKYSKLKGGIEISTQLAYDVLVLPAGTVREWDCRPCQICFPEVKS